MSRYGFTLLELLIVISLIGLLAFIATPIYATMQKNVALKNELLITIDALRTAQYRSMISMGNYSHGVYFNRDGFYVYGDSWVAPAYVEYHPFGHNIVVTQGIDSDIQFDRLTGATAMAVMRIGYEDGDSVAIDVLRTGTISTNE